MRINFLLNMDFFKQKRPEPCRYRSPDQTLPFEIQATNPLKRCLISNANNATRNNKTQLKG
jgi:hypothetical protein